MEDRKIILAIGGSSGSIYAQRLLTKIRDLTGIKLGVVMTDNAISNWEIEIGMFSVKEWPFTFYDKNDFNAPFASGSAKYDTMIICPSSMGLIGRIANGHSNDLITSSRCDPERKKKIDHSPQETPYNLIHLKNMTKLTKSGAIICPATPSFYSKPQNIEELADTVIDRVLDLASLGIKTYRWGENMD